MLVYYIYCYYIIFQIIDSGYENKIFENKINAIKMRCTS